MKLICMRCNGVRYAISLPEHMRCDCGGKLAAVSDDDTKHDFEQDSDDPQELELGDALKTDMINTKKAAKPNRPTVVPPKAG